MSSVKSKILKSHESIDSAAESWRPLGSNFFEESASEVAPKLLGHYLLRRTPGGWAGGIIVEAEAYLIDDPACHAFRGMTPRTAVMFGPPGRAYVYFTYGCHHCANFVCRPEGVAEAVLIRALEPTHGIDWMKSNRPVDRVRDLASGPGKLTQSLAIDRTLDGSTLDDPAGQLFAAHNPDRKATIARLGPIVITPRIGVNQAVDWPLRYVLSGSDSISRPIRNPRPPG